MAQLTAVPTLVVNTTEGVCSVKVTEPSIETVLLSFIAGWLQDGQARLIRLPSNVLVTGSIVDSPSEDAVDG
ncbi:hypothetical protein DEA98_10505 [Brucella pseudogrignonensis]|uniref:Uncharacterized protein n=2 Tax=Brucella pseudogrignonensis TaxID=419475 RepID=A0A7Y3T763_9HYPH|nr:hypothetical protein [Brucella pseudogrignonensis]MCM0751623.1 hypothetical protein [Brucella pseudogrignonensis]NNV22021.1 hypothetical protein [Brucella pseudogrignonensis]